MLIINLSFNPFNFIKIAIFNSNLYIDLQAVLIAPCETKNNKQPRKVS